MRPSNAAAFRPLRLSPEMRPAGIAECQAIVERLTDMDIGIGKRCSFVVLKSSIVKAPAPLPSLFAR